MRFIDRFAIDHPNEVRSDYLIGCPWAYHYETKEAGDAVCGSVSCKWCWEREMDESTDTSDWDLGGITEEVFGVEV